MAVEEYQIEWLQEQIYELQNEIRELQMENELLRNDLNTIKHEGCWRFVEDKNHLHKSSDKPISGDV
jgi:regulator of replication initiation timing